MSRSPKRSRAVSTTRSRSAGCVASAATPTQPISAAACSIAAASREKTTTLAPSSARARATALPSPLLAAATTAVLPVSPRSIQQTVLQVVGVDGAQVDLGFGERDLLDQHVRIVAP